MSNELVCKKCSYKGHDGCLCDDERDEPSRAERAAIRFAYGQDTIPGDSRSEFDDERMHSYFAGWSARENEIAVLEAILSQTRLEHPRSTSGILSSPPTLPVGPPVTMKKAYFERFAKAKGE